MTPAFLPPAQRVLLAVVLSGAPVGPIAAARAQSPGDLRRENQRLRTEGEDLRRELEALRAEVQRLTEENRRLRAGPAARPPLSTPPPPTRPTPPPRVTIDESKPSASPRALLAALVASYGEATGAMDIGDSTASTARAGYLRKLTAWTRRVNRRFKTTIEWHVKMAGQPVPVARGYALRLVAIDPETRVQLGDPFDAFLPLTDARRLRGLERRRGLTAVLVLRGVLVPRVHLNEDRYDEGPFDNPRFIGPFAEFAFTVDVGTLLPVPEKTEGPEKTKTPAAPAGTGAAGR